jgi:hypothetical protein
VVPSVPIYSLGAYEASEPIVIVPSDFTAAGTKAAAAEPVDAVVVAAADALLEEELEQALSSSAPARTTPVTAEIRLQPKPSPSWPLSFFRVDKGFLHLFEVPKIASYPHANQPIHAQIERRRANEMKMVTWVIPEDTQEIA